MLPFRRCALVLSIGVFGCFSSYAAAECRRLEAGEIRVVALIELYDWAQAHGSDNPYRREPWLPVTELVDRLAARMAPCGAGLDVRGEATLFEKKVRNMAYAIDARTNMIVQGLAEYREAESGEPAAWRILENGEREVEHWRRWVD